MIYCFKCEACGKTEDFVLPVDLRNQMQLCPHCKGGMLRDAMAERAAPVGLEYQQPVHSEAMACDPSDIPTREKLTGVKHDPLGRPILTSHQERKRFMKKLGFHDRRGFY